MVREAGGSRCAWHSDCVCALFHARHPTISLTEDVDRCHQPGRKVGDILLIRREEDRVSGWYCLTYFFLAMYGAFRS